MVLIKISPVILMVLIGFFCRKTEMITTEGMEQYLSAFKHGMPPHGGLGIGMERLTMKMMNEDNVRETTLFPRDLSRLEP